MLSIVAVLINIPPTLQCSFLLLLFFFPNPAFMLFLVYLFCFVFISLVIAILMNVKWYLIVVLFALA